jgi:hypothetical protein
MNEQKQLEQLEFYYTIQGGDFFFNGSQKVKSNFVDEGKLTNVFRQTLAKRFPIESTRPKIVSTLRHQTIYPAKFF